MTVKIFKLNDYEWVAAKSFDEAVEWHMKAHRLSFEDSVDPSCAPHECSTEMIVNVDMDYVMDYLNEDEVTVADFDPRLKCYKVPAHYIIEKDYKGEPFILCSTEFN